MTSRATRKAKRASAAARTHVDKKLPSNHGPAETPWWRRGWALLTAGVLTLGALASAITAILSLWPEPDSVDVAEITSIGISPRVPLSEWQRHKAKHGSWQPPSDARLPRALRAIDVQQTDSPTPSPIDGTSPSPGLNRRIAYPDLIQKIAEVAPQYALPESDEPAHAPIATIVQEIRVHNTGETMTLATAASQLAGVLGETRSVVLPSGKLDPLGVAVTANLRVEGLRNRKLDVCWRITGKAGTRTPYTDWLDEVAALDFIYLVQVIIKDGSRRLVTASSDPFE
jgi:hypothetical protein